MGWGRRGEYGSYLAPCDESEEDLMAMVGHFVEVCRRRCLKVNEGRIRVLILNVEEQLECEVLIRTCHEV